MIGPVLFLSDLHCHNWSVFSTKDATGKNSRLSIILSEIQRAVEELMAAGGDTIVLAGDLMHARGSIDPEVFNPVSALFSKFSQAGLRVLAIPGNHDLKGRETTELGNSMQSLGELLGFHVYTETTLLPRYSETKDGLAFIPWCSTNAGIRAEVEKLKEMIRDQGENIDQIDLVMHAGINGVLIGVPDHGLDVAEVESWGFRRVFSGHYHNHVEFPGGKVISIGATTHQTFSDVDTKAGFLLVREDGFAYRASRAPSFVSIDASTEPEEIPLIVDGNYVRVRDMELDQDEIKALHKELIASGAAGVLFDVVKKVASTRTGSVTAKVSSLEGSIATFIGKQTYDDPAAINAACLDILTAVRTPAL